MKRLFEIPQSQKKGVILMLIIIFLLLIFRFSLHYLIKPSEKFTVITSEKGLTNLLDSLETTHKKEFPDSLFYFNPNTVSEEELKKLGLHEKIARRWILFRSKGFVFKAKEDVKRVYGVSQEWYEKVSSFIRLSNPQILKPLSAKEQTISSFQEKKSFPEKSYKQIDLNTADSVELEKLPMIGPALAHRIIAYRKLLGGFIKKEQLREVFGLKEENYTAIEKKVYVDADFVPEKINLMKADFKTINRHPYIPYEITKKICNMRKKTNLNPEILCTIVENDTLCKRISPYVLFD